MGALKAFHFYLLNLLTFSFPPSLVGKVRQLCQTLLGSAFGDFIKSGILASYCMQAFLWIAAHLTFSCPERFDNIVKPFFLGDAPECWPETPHFSPVAYLPSWGTARPHGAFCGLTGAIAG